MWKVRPLYAASVLAARVLTWTDTCDIAARHGGYLLKTAKVWLTMHHSIHNKPANLWRELQRDADLYYPCSQRGVVETRKIWMSPGLQQEKEKKQRNTPAAAVITGHEDQKTAIPIMPMIKFDNGAELHE